MGTIIGKTVYKKQLLERLYRKNNYWKDCTEKTIIGKTVQKKQSM